VEQALVDDRSPDGLPKEPSRNEAGSSMKKVEQSAIHSIGLVVLGCCGRSALINDCSLYWLLKSHPATKQEAQPQKVE